MRPSRRPAMPPSSAQTHPVDRPRRLLGRLPPVVQRRDYALLLVALCAMSLGTQMVAVAVAWQVYAIHRSALYLGLIGLAEFMPLPLLALPSAPFPGQVSRRLVFVILLGLECGCRIGPYESRPVGS